MAQENIYEQLKKSFFNTKDKTKSFSDTDVDSLNIDRTFNVDTVDDISPTIGFFDHDIHSQSNEHDPFGRKMTSNDMKLAALAEQKRYIEVFRSISEHPDVASGIQEIVNEIVFNTGHEDLLKLMFNDDVSDNVQEMLQNALEEVCDILDFNENAYDLIRTWYVDGQIVFNPVFDNTNLQRGLVRVNILSPINLYYDLTSKTWAYIQEEQQNDFTFSSQWKISERKFKHEELFKVDSGLYQDPTYNKGGVGTEKLVMSELGTAIKPANQLKTSEDMLIPMRFSRSVSRRVFNVDVGDLSHNKSNEALAKIQAQFKYKKFYDVDNGTISNQNHIATLVEDYWFQNRSGGRGTTVDTLDETGNLGELGDILYFKKKLYTAMKIPMSRINNEVEGVQAEFDFSATSVQRDEVKFFAFVQRLRRKFLKAMYELMMRHLIAQGKITVKEWRELSKKFNIYFNKENTFLENLNMEIFEKRVQSYQNIEEMIGKVFSVEYVLKNVMKMSDDDIKMMQEQMEYEKSGDKYKSYYGSDEDEGGGW